MGWKVLLKCICLRQQLCLLAPAAKHVSSALGSVGTRDPSCALRAVFLWVEHSDEQWTRGVRDGDRAVKMRGWDAEARGAGLSRFEGASLMR